MNLPNKMKIVNAEITSDTIMNQFNSLPLDKEYVVVFRTGGKLPFDELLPLTRKMGKPLVYGENDFFSFDKVHLECELHYDGISSDGIRAMPDWLIFYMENTPNEEGGEFRLLNCESVLHDLDKELVEFLESTALEIYGLRHLSDPDPEPYKLSFKIKNIVTEQGIKILRMHIPTADSNMMVVEPEFVHCKIDDFRMRFEGMTGPETDEIFSKIRKVAFSDKHLLEIGLKKGDIVFVKNRFVFHGRNSCAAPTTRLMHRIQLINE